MELRVLDPTAESVVSTIKTTSLSTRLDTMEAKNIGILVNQKGGAIKFQPFIEKSLKERFSTLRFETWSLGYTNWPGKQKRIKDMAASSDAIVALVGD
jgi:hypothetical protein